MHMNLARRGVLVLAAVGIALGTAAFASSASATTTVASPHSVPQAVTPLKVALVAPSATNDLSWTQTMYAALESLKSSQHLSISVFHQAHAENKIGLPLVGKIQHALTKEANRPGIPEPPGEQGKAQFVGVDYVIEPRPDAGQDGIDKATVGAADLV